MEPGNLGRAGGTDSGLKNRPHAPLRMTGFLFKLIFIFIIAVIHRHCERSRSDSSFSSILSRICIMRRSS